MNQMSFENIGNHQQNQQPSNMANLFAPYNPNSKPSSCSNGINSSSELGSQFGPPGVSTALNGGGNALVQSNDLHMRKDNQVLRKYYSIGKTILKETFFKKRN